MTEKFAYSMKELVEIHPGSRSVIYEEIKAGRLVARKMGDRTIVLRSDYLDYLAALPKIENKVGAS